jgi:hypothetical protein
LSTAQALQSFADGVASIRGDEPSEAQTDVNRLLHACGWADALIEATLATVLVEMKCNFDQIWLYDFNQVVDELLVRLEVAELARARSQRRGGSGALGASVKNRETVA